MQTYYHIVFFATDGVVMSFLDSLSRAFVPGLRIGALWGVRKLPRSYTCVLHCHGVDIIGFCKVRGRGTPVVRLLR